jgi:hypothetical protein
MSNVLVVAFVIVCAPVPYRILRLPPPEDGKINERVRRIRRLSFGDRNHLCVTFRPLQHFKKELLCRRKRGRLPEIVEHVSDAKAPVYRRMAAAGTDCTIRRCGFPILNLAP